MLSSSGILITLLKDEEKIIKHKHECKEFVSDARESIRG
jgi:hypothetical protein